MASTQRNMARPETPLGKADKIETGAQGWSKLRGSVDARLVALETYRYSWWVHWRDLADYILPRRYRWIITGSNRSSLL